MVMHGRRRVLRCRSKFTRQTPRRVNPECTYIQARAGQRVSHISGIGSTYMTVAGDVQEQVLAKRTTTLEG